MITECPSLVVTLIVTLRKFVSLIVSIFYFRNPFTLQHWMATALVFSGTLLFSGILQSAGLIISSSSRSRSGKKLQQTLSTEVVNNVMKKKET